MTLAALLNALRVVGKAPEDVRVVVTGAGAAGMACTNIMLAHGIEQIVVCDIGGALYSGRPGLDPMLQELAERTNPLDERGTADELLVGADVYLGVSGPGAVSPEAIRRWRRARSCSPWPTRRPRCMPEEVADSVAIMATGRSDYPNQINNVLAFPGVFRGALDVRASTINEEMKLAAARAIAALVGRRADPEYIIPSAFNRDVAPAVAREVAAAAEATAIRN